MVCGNILFTVFCRRDTLSTKSTKFGSRYLVRRGRNFKFGTLIVRASLTVH